jgi:hypothetical protein
MRRTALFCLREMRVKGLALHMEYENGRAQWFLGDDKRPLAEGVGLSVARDLNVAGVGDTLFEGTPHQTFRYVHERRRA